MSRATRTAAIAPLLAVAACAQPHPVAAPVTSAPLLSIRGDFAPGQAWPELELAPQIRCDGGAVLVPLETTYGGERSPVGAAILDRAGKIERLLDLDAIVDELDGRDPAAVRHKLAAANAELAAQCWRPMPGAGEDTWASWTSPTLTVSHLGHAVHVTRDDVTRPIVADDNCGRADRVEATFIDPERHLALVSIAHEMQDNCGSDPPSWISLELPAVVPAPQFVCGLPSRAAFDAARQQLYQENLVQGRDHPLGTCQARLEGEQLSVRQGATLIYTDKEAGPAWGYDRAFWVQGARPGDDAGLAGAVAQERGLIAIRCTAFDVVVQCSFKREPEQDCGSDDDLYFEIEADPTAVDPELVRDPQQLRGRPIVAVVLVMPC